MENCLLLTKPIIAEQQKKVKLFCKPLFSKYLKKLGVLFSVLKKRKRADFYICGACKNSNNERYKMASVICTIFTV